MSNSRTLLTIVFAAFVLAVAGCGAGSDADQIKDVTTDFFNGVKDGDGGKACDALAKAARAETDASGKGCEASIEALAKSADKDEIKDAKVSVSNVKVTGKKATAHVTSTTKGKPKSETDISYVKEGGDWKIADLS